MTVKGIWDGMLCRDFKAYKKERNRPGDKLRKHETCDLKVKFEL